MVELYELTSFYDKGSQSFMHLLVECRKLEIRPGGNHLLIVRLTDGSLVVKTVFLHIEITIIKD